MGEEWVESSAFPSAPSVPPLAIDRVLERLPGTIAPPVLREVARQRLRRSHARHVRRHPDVVPPAKRMVRGQRLLPENVQDREPGTATPEGAQERRLIHGAAARD